MNTKVIFLSFATLLIWLSSTLTSAALNPMQSTAITHASNAATEIEVIQFHSKHRCVTCNKIEAYTLEALKEFPNISFSLVDVGNKKNEKKAEQFKATGTALFLFNPKTGKKKELTDFAFMNVGNKSKFIEGLKVKIKKFED